MKTNKLPSFSINRKGILAIILCFAVLTSAITYALIQNTATVHQHLKILGGGVELWIWEEVDGVERYSLEYLADDCGGLIGGENWESQLLVLAVGVDCSIKQVLTFNDTLPENVGYVLWQVELSAHGVWKWYNWTDGRINVGAEIDNWVYLPGTPNNPIEPLQKIGLRSGSSSQGDTGHLKYTIYTYETAPCAEYDFDITVTGTEYAYA